MTILPLSREMVTSSPPGGGAAVAREADAAINNRHASRRRPERRVSIARLDGRGKFRVLRFVPGRPGSSQLTQPMTYNSRVPMEGEMRRTAAVFVALVLGCGLMVSNVVRSEAPDARLKGAARRAPVNGWTYVRLEGTPAEIGFQNGYLLSAGDPGPREGLLDRDSPRHRPRLGVLPRRGRAHAVAAYRGRVSRRAAGYRRRSPREARQPRSLGRRRRERRARVELLHRAVRQDASGWAHQALYRRALQRLHRHRQLHEGRHDRHRAQQLEQLPGRRALDDRIRRAAGKGPSVRHGRAARRDSQRRRLRPQRRGHRHHRDHHHASSRGST